VGTGVPLHRGAGAKLLLAHLSEQEQQRYISHATAEFADLKGRVNRLKAELDDIRTSGHSVSVGDLVEDLWSVAAPVRRAGEVVAALSLVGPVYRMPQSAKPELVRAVKRSADEISAEISRRFG
jgi:DNA-binding IclR family transcriptional regulator